MDAGRRIARYAGIMVLCLGSLSSANAARAQKKAKKPQSPPLPSGPTGRPVPQLPLDSIAPVAPQVTYENGQLTIVAPNSSLGDILRAVRKQTGAEIEVPDAKERVVTRLGPAPAREVIAELLNGSRFNYVLLGSPGDGTFLTRVVLVARTGSGADTGTPANQPPQQQAALRSRGVMAPQVDGQQDGVPEADPADPAPDDSATADDNADQPAAEADQPVANPDQPGVKTPQQLLQEMQQRQLQMQQQQPPGQSVPAPGQVPPPQEQQ